MAEARVKPPTKLCPIIITSNRVLETQGLECRCLRGLCAWWVPRGESTGYCGAIGCEAGEAQMAAELYAANRKEAKA